MTITLKGMTWDHDRGYLPLEAASQAFKKQHPNVDITWHKRSLQAFADRPLNVIAAEYDFLIIDHPHVGDAAQNESIISLNDKGFDQELAALSKNSMGPSHASYHIEKNQWALAIDAAAQFSCYRPDLLETPPSNWDEVLTLAKQGKVLFPLKPVDAIDSFFTLCANMGDPVAQSTHYLVPPETAKYVLELMYQIAQNVPKTCLKHNPIDTLELMSQGSQYAYCPLLFGYTNYSRDGYRDHLIQFTDIPALGNLGCAGSIIGGTGIAISSQCKHQSIALDFAFMVAGESFQTNEYFSHAGQPAHQQAWLNKRNDDYAHQFFSQTFQTLDKSWLRPRYQGFLYFADKGGDLINDFLAGKEKLSNTIMKLEQYYQESLLADKAYQYE